MKRRFNIENGWDVLGSDNKKIGSVRGCTESYCHIDTGFLGLGPDYFVPMDAVYNVRPGEVILNVRSDELDRMNWEQRPSSTAAAPTTAARPARGAEEMERPTRDVEGQMRRMPLREEEIHVRKHRENVGEVEVTKEVREEVRHIEVPVSREEVVIKTRPAHGDGGPIGEPDTLRVPVSEERVDVEKETHVYGEVDVEKERYTEQQPFTERVRKEVPHVEKHGDVTNVREGELTEKERLERDERNRPLGSRKARDRDLTEKERLDRESR